MLHVLGFRSNRKSQAFSAEAEACGTGQGGNVDIG